MTHAPEILLEHHLKRLKLPTFLREYKKVARQCAAEGLDHVQFLTRLALTGQGGQSTASYLGSAVDCV